MKHRNLIQAIITAFGSIAHALVSGRNIPSKQMILLETTVAGFQYYAGEDLFPQLCPDQPLTLQRESNNHFDENAVALYWEDIQLGYLPRSDNVVIAQMMDWGELLGGRVCELFKGTY